jgi:hypothetical protein
MKTMLIFIPMLALGLLFVWGTRRLYYSRRRNVTRSDGPELDSWRAGDGS